MKWTRSKGRKDTQHCVQAGFEARIRLVSHMALRSLHTDCAHDHLHSVPALRGARRGPVRILFAPDAMNAGSGTPAHLVQGVFLQFSTALFVNARFQA
jgi:hypothetical protein